MFRCSWQHICLVSTAVVVACLFPPQRASGWSESGHKVIANIAYDRLDPVVRAKIVKVLKRHDDFEMRFKNKMPLDIQKSNQEDQDRWIFLQASIWPDLIRSQSKYHRPTWHFVNQPLFLSEHDEMVLAASIKPNVDPVLPDPLTTAGRDQLNCVQALKLCVRELSDADNSDSERAIYFCWLLHLGGDTHQPCHSTSLVSRARFNKSSGDRGGNLINIKQGKNLHGFWDGLMGSSQSLNDIRGRAVAILASAEVSTAATTASKKLKFEDWIAESFLISKESVYIQLIKDAVTAAEGDASKPLGRIDLPLEYRKNAGNIAQRRAAEAGYRLAEILKQIEE